MIEGTEKSALEGRVRETISIMEYVWEGTNKGRANEKMLQRRQRSEGMRAKRLAARSGHRAFAAGWPTSSTEGVRWRPDVETGRFLFDDGPPLLRRPVSEKPQRYRRVKGWATDSEDARSYLR